MPRGFRTLLLAFVAIVMVVMLALLIFETGQPPSLPPVPNPNGYDDFVKASAAVLGNVSDFPTLDRDTLERLVSTNAEPLRLLRLGLTRRCLMPMGSALTNDAARLSQLADMKRLVQLLAAEGRLREMDNRPGDAARSYMDSIQFGNEMSRGGFIITRLVGVACESIGCHALAKVVNKLSRDETRAVLTELEKLDADHVTWAEVQRGERRFVRYQLRNRLNPILRAISWWQSRQALERAEARHTIVIAHERLLMAEMGLRCYQSEQARVPERLDDLLTNYLAKVPSDPFSRQPLSYRPQGTNWLLYSIGPDGVDDGGRPAGKGWPVKGDLLVDSPW